MINCDHSMAGVLLQCLAMLLIVPLALLVPPAAARVAYETRTVVAGGRNTFEMTNGEYRELLQRAERSRQDDDRASRGGAVLRRRLRPVEADSAAFVGLIKPFDRRVYY